MVTYEEKQGILQKYLSIFQRPTTHCETIRSIKHIW